MNTEALESANIPLAEYIKDELAARGWEINKFVGLLLSEKDIPLDKDTVNKLAKYFHVSEDFLLNLDKNYRAN